MTNPHIIRTTAELEALDADTVLFTWGNMEAQPWLHVFEDDLPAVVIATGEQVMAARKALEEADRADA